MVIAMQLTENYLSQVSQHLPQDTRDDIVSELRDDIAEQVHAKAEAAGREPDEQDERTVLAGFGHPLKVASAYKPRRYLIGPELYPAWVQTLQVLLMLALAVALALTFAFSPVHDWSDAVSGVLSRWFSLACWSLGIATLVFVSMEATGERLGWYHNWTPDSLTGSAGPPVNYGDVVTNLVTEAVFLAWWNGSILNADDQLGEWASSAIFAPVWQSFFWPLNIVMGVFFVLHVYVLLRRSWPRWASLLELVLCIGLIAALFALLLNQPLLQFAGDTSKGFAFWASRTLTFVLLVIAGFTIWDGVLAARRLR